MEDHYKRFEGIDFPRTKLLLRTKEGTKSLYGPPSIIFPSETPVTVGVENDEVLSLEGSDMRQSPMFSADGSMVCILSAVGSPIRVMSSATGELRASISVVDAEYVEFSPLGTYVVTWSRPKKQPQQQQETPAVGNLQVWHVGQCTMVASFNQRVLKKSVIQWNADESCCMRIVTNEIHLLLPSGANGSFERASKVYHKNISQFSLAPNSSHPFVAAFTPEGSGGPAKVSLYRYSQQDGSNWSFEDTGICRTLFSASECKMLWRPNEGDRVLIQTQSDVDSSGGSYYGATGLFIVSVDGSVSRPVPQSKDGHVYSVQWSPDGSCFIMAAGKMPCHVTMFNPAGEPVYEFGALYRDVISFSPHGRFLCLAGFGNLGGDMNFYEITSSKRRQIGTASSHGAIGWGWSPDSRYFMTCTLTPRMNVDNGFKLFKYNGVGPVVDYKVGCLYDAQWVPCPTERYPDRGRSPSRAGASSTQATPAPKPVAAAPYRPPGSTGSLSNMLKREQHQGPKGKVGANGTAPTQKAPAYKPSVRTIPGAPPPQPKAAGKGGSKKKAKPQAAPAAVPPPPPPAESETVEIDPSKKKKNLQKKLKQVEELKAKRDAGVELKPEQIRKIATEEDIRKEIADLGI
mmetsp:Transcript_22707/g.33179  ORF Transcript_22707/g.33179 Transcript_22707/m.33179 type:complete len:628 (+) Transcript_22707:31-1914(+)|eukprot:CAMPEP_0185018498 /NCGR_PEP_ID=MMETSP1103-20130426/1203_1 /TAXON_ID=36769 /ORGANISM="Paraphysomonas bandaiensis, Strain Caron Lab Isolate" /LENGTH=627 /DNA_ID=CAMNT_0027548335 /DNA_START=22 /DNA_END=1905 /DNA_ORIENTATION=-